MAGIDDRGVGQHDRSDHWHIPVNRFGAQPEVLGQNRSLEQFGQVEEIGQATFTVLEGQKSQMNTLLPNQLMKHMDEPALDPGIAPAAKLQQSSLPELLLI